MATYPKEVQKVLSEADLPSVRVCQTDNHVRTGPVYLHEESADKFLQQRNSTTKTVQRQPQGDCLSKLDMLLERVNELHVKIDRLM